MKILLINQCHYPRGGADIVYLNMIKLLQSKGHEVACFSTQNFQNEESNYNEYFVPSVDPKAQNFTQKINHVIPYLYNQKAYSQLRKLITDFKPDISHVHLFYASLSISVLNALNEFQIPIVHTVHDYRLLCPENSLLDNNRNICEKCAKGSPINCIQKKCSEGNFSQSAMIAIEAFYWRNLNSPIKRIDHYHFVSNFCRDKHAEYIPNILEKSSVFYNFSTLKKEQITRKNNRYYLYYGRLTSVKGVLTLIEAWKHLPSSMKLMIVGEGDQSKQIKALITIYRLQNVELLGYKSGNDLYNLIENAHFIIVPSEWYENNPMTIIESYHLGVPVIGSEIGGIPEIVKENNTGFLFPPKDWLKLKEILLYADNLNIKEYSSMTSHCLLFAKKHFSSESFYNKLISMYNKVLGR